MSESVPVSEAKHIAKRYNKRCVIISVMDDSGSVETIVYGSSSNPVRISTIINDHSAETSPS